MNDCTFVYALRVRKEPTALERITSTLRRRGHELVSLHMSPGEQPGVFDMTVELRPRAGRQEHVAAELSKLWPILDVIREGSAAVDAL